MIPVHFLRGRGRFFGLILCVVFVSGLFSKAVLCQEPDQELEKETAELISPPEQFEPAVKRDFRGVAVFGITTATSLVSLSLVYLGIGYASDWNATDTSLIVGSGIALALAPGVGVALSDKVTKKSTHYTSPVRGMLIGGYLGAALALTGSFFYLRADDPHADGQYEGGYFSDDDHAWRAVGAVVFSYVLPIVTPGLGAFIGYLVGRRPRRFSDAVSISPPTPTIFKETDNKGKTKYSFGVKLVQMTF